MLQEQGTFGLAHKLNRADAEFEFEFALGVKTQGLEPLTMAL